MSDATIAARGSLRFRGQVEWTRFDALLGPEGTTTIPLGASLTGFMDVGVLPLLATAQTAAQVLAKAPALQLGLGTIRTTADSRIASVPIALEYGVANRFSVGITLPIVQTRTVITAQLNGRGDSSANVGPNPAAYFTNLTAYAANAGVVSALDNARQQLASRIAACAAAPTSAGCPAFNARLAEANALVTDAADFAGAARVLYGTDVAANRGEPFVPLGSSTTQKAIDTHLADLRTAFTSFGFSAGTGAFASANGPAANTQLFDLVNDPAFGIGLDSIGTTDQIALGDMELSAAAQLFNSFPDSMSGFHMRTAVAGVLRLGTGHPPRGGRPLEVGTGDGQTDIEARAAMDIALGRRLLTTVAGTVTIPVTSAHYDRLPGPPLSGFVFTGPTPGSLKPGTMAAVRINPRLFLSRAVSIGGLLDASHRAADMATPTPLPDTLGSQGVVPEYATTNATTSWSLGLSFSYSNIGSHSGTGTPDFPAEVTYSHLELVGANAGGLPHSRRDAIELRLYFRTRR